MTTCACGCGREINDGTTYARGHHWRVKRAQRGVPDTKTCERCGAEYSRAGLRVRQSNTHWLRRRFCSEECRRADRAEQSRERRGEAHPGWKGDTADPLSGRMRARREYADIPPCEVCGDSKSERHHKDGDTLNNAPSNIAFLCRKHHIAAEDRMAYRRIENTMTPEQQQARLERRRAQARERTRRYRARKKADS